MLASLFSARTEITRIENSSENSDRVELLHETQFFDGNFQLAVTGSEEAVAMTGVFDALETCNLFVVDKKIWDNACRKSYDFSPEESSAKEIEFNARQRIGAHWVRWARTHISLKGGVISALQVFNKIGIHGRPSAMICRITNAFPTTQTFAWKEDEEGAVVIDAKDIQDIMMLGARKGSIVYILSVGDDANIVSERLELLFMRKFDEL
jgi:phosphocarrier protein HPr